VTSFGRPPLPVETVRDLLAIARALHASRQSEGAPLAELQKLAAATTALTNSLNMAHATRSSIGARAAWGWAEQGLTLLAEALCREDAAAQLFVAAWGARLLKR